MFRIHAESVNLARRLSAQNESDLLMESLYDDEVKQRNYTRIECASIASHLVHLKQLPMQCMKYKDVANDLRRRDSDTTHGSEVLS
ncbi:hypothetical protein ACA910_011308 [Epithemia clementina (nom. ined.)]